MRLGDRATRFTTDLDVARASLLDEFSDHLAASLSIGWEGFIGTLVKGRQARPKNVPSEYVMQPFSVKLSYNSKPWVTAKLEVGHNEIGDADSPDAINPEGANAILEKLGFPPLGPIPVVALHHQIAQKFHAVSAPGSTRAHDLIDLQLLDASYEGDYSDIRATCTRLFAYRKMQDWPPVIEKGTNWETAYADQLPTGTLIPEVDGAITWTNTLISRIDDSR